MTECIWRRIPKKPKETKNLRRSQKHQKLTVKEQGSSAGKSVRQTHFRNLVTENSFAVVRKFYVVRERHSLWWYVKQFALCVCVKINVHGTNIYSFCIHPTQQLKCILLPAFLNNLLPLKHKQKYIERALFKWETSQDHSDLQWVFPFLNTQCVTLDSKMHFSQTWIHMF